MDVSLMVFNMKLELTQMKNKMLWFWGVVSRSYIWTLLLSLGAASWSLDDKVLPAGPKIYFLVHLPMAGELKIFTTQNIF